MEEDAAAAAAAAGGRGKIPVWLSSAAFPHPDSGWRDIEIVAVAEKHARMSYASRGLVY